MPKKKYTRDRSKHREEIVEATKLLIEKNGYSELSIRDITEKTGLSTGLIYKNFPKGKADIVLEICRLNVSAVIDPLDFLMAPLDDFPKIFKNTIKENLKSHQEHQKLNEALEAAVLMTPELKSEIDNLIGGLMEFMPKLLENLQKQSVVDVPDPAKWGEWIATTIDAIIHRHILYNSYHASDEQLVDFIFEAMSRILKLKI